MSQHSKTAANSEGSSFGDSETELLRQLFPLEENLNASITVSLKELEDRFIPYPALRPAWEALKLFLRRPGKRVRPLLFLFSYRLFDERHEIPPMPAFHAAAALEIFHAFALIHDDIIDQSHSRRGAPTLHKSLEQESGIAPQNCENLSLVLGDILFGFAMERFLDPGFAPSRATRAMRYFLRVAQDTGLGQAVEVAHLEASLDRVSEQEILQTYYLKTARYTIECPLILGAILAGSNQSIERVLTFFANPLGLAFQIENDLHEVRQLLKGDMELAYDLHIGVKTLFIKRLFDRSTALERERLKALLEDENAEGLARLLGSRQAALVEQSLIREVGDYFKEAQAVMRHSDLPQVHIQGLLQFVDFIRMNSHHSESALPEKLQSASA